MFLLFFKRLLRLPVLVILLSACSYAVQESVSFTHYVINADQTPTDELASLLSFFEIKHDNTAASIVAATQKAWLRPAGVERAHTVDLWAEYKEQLMPKFKKLQLIDAVVPKSKKYCYGIIHGAMVSTVRTRLAYLKTLWNEGVRFNQLVFLGGQRALDPVHEGRDVLLSSARPDWLAPQQLPTVEIEAMRMVYDQANLPQDLRELPVVFIDVPMLKTEAGTMRRPNTQDTVEAWLGTNPQPGSCLAVSNQPYVAYQNASTLRFLPPYMSLETVGSAIAQEDASVAVILDSLARWLYQEEKIRINH